ncbi:hypothetical protein [Phaeodactylibacter luteus]|nr:hypothetical protein [Phaeodactylibacter luteus]
MRKYKPWKAKPGGKLSGGHAVSPWEAELPLEQGQTLTCTAFMF